MKMPPFTMRDLSPSVATNIAICYARIQNMFFLNEEFEHGIYFVDPKGYDEYMDKGLEGVTEFKFFTNEKEGGIEAMRESFAEYCDEAISDVDHRDIIWHVLDCIKNLDDCMKAVFEELQEENDEAAIWQKQETKLILPNGI